MCPIHIAAPVGALDAIDALVDRNDRDSAALRDNNNGRTLLHVAVEHEKGNVVKLVCREPRFAGILNMKDNDGNTALHLAVKKGDRSIFSHLLGNRAVELNHVNEESYTPLDLVRKRKTEHPFASRQNPTEWMIRALAHSRAHFSARRRDEFLSTSDSGRTQANEVKKLTRSTESVLVASVLIATLTSAAAFTVPGEYKIDDHPKAGSPALGAKYGFKVFIVADTFAFFCSVAATFSLAEFGNRANVDPRVRCIYARRAVAFFHFALKCIITAFALGVAMVMVEISVSTTIVVGAITSLLVLYGNVPLRQDFQLMYVMYRRFGFSRSWSLNPSTNSHLDWSAWRNISFSATLVVDLVKLFWTYIVIFLVAYLAQL